MYSLQIEYAKEDKNYTLLPVYKIKYEYYFLTFYIMIYYKNIMSFGEIVLRYTYFFFVRM